VGTFIGSLTSRPGVLPQLLISPHALTAGNGHNYPDVSAAGESEDALVDLLRHHESLSQEEFLEELHRQRSSEEVPSS